MTSWSPPLEFEEYRLLRELGRGGMGQVYLAHDTLLDRHIAIKFISEERGSAVARDRFLVEARAAARLHHPNVVAVHRVGQFDDRPYLVAEFVRGVSLKGVDKPVPWKRALEYGVGLARGLAAAHREGVLHRDIKPANAILADSGEVKLLDFGLAKLSNVTAEAATNWPDSSSESLVAVKAALAGAPSFDAGDTQTAPSQWAAGSSQQPAPGLTQAGAIMGTPYYMPPEIWRGEPATRHSDVYSLGALLFELCAGRPPHGDVGGAALKRAAVEEDAPGLCDLVPETDPRFGAIVDRCLRREPEARFADGDDLREALEALSPNALRSAVPEGNPYRGLHRFEAEHRALFFGRGAEVRDVVERLRADSFVLVAGDSGVGKSSLCRAGVLPIAEEEGLGDEREWTVTRIVPGTHPMSAIAAALSGEVLEDIDDVSAADIVRQLRLSVGEGGLILFVDQLEELLTLSDEREAALAADVIGRIAAGIPGMRVLATARCDFLTRLAAVPKLGDSVGRALYLLRPLTPQSVRDVIAAPARAKGVEFESVELISLLAESAEEPGGLPLLEFALAELWEARDVERSVITAAALENIGGVGGALARHADDALAAMLPAQRAAVRGIVVRLVTGEATRARRTKAELCGGETDSESALDALVRARLVAAYGGSGPDDDATYEVAHEALLSRWHTLADWLDKSAEHRAVHDRLRLAAGEWARLDRPRDALWSIAQLNEAGVLSVDDLNSVEKSFIGASRRASKRRARVRWGVAIAIPLVVVATYSALWLRESLERRDAVQRRLSEADAVLSRAVVDLRRASDARILAYAAFDALDEDAESRWAEALALAHDADRGYQDAAQVLETAFTVDPSRKDVRRRLAGAFYERALLAERERRTEAVDELLKRIALHDEDGRFLSKWSEPAELSISTSPAGAIVTIWQYQRRPDETFELVGRREIGTAPVVIRSLAPGSYLVELATPGRATVRYPIVLGRGARVAETIALPNSDAIPEGFAYVPPGRFMLGYAGSESLRRGFFKTAPIHEVAIDAFVISRHEGTIGDYIEYLELQPRERWPDLLPQRSSDIIVADLDLRKIGDATWELSLKPNTKRYVARTGQPLAYDDRNHRARQDWTRFPMAGLSAAQVEAYADWLDSTGRVPRARMCTEREWVRAARGADARAYPHGDAVRPDDANFDVTYGQRPLAFGPDEVGSHPASDSPFGVQDMAGNVFEFVRASVSQHQWAVLGGSYYHSNDSLRVSNRETPEPSFAHGSLGFRICADL